MSQFITQEYTALFFIGFLLFLIGGSGAIEVEGVILRFVAFAVAVSGLVLMYPTLARAKR